MTILAGIDLSWNGKNPSGVCVIEAQGDALELLRLDDPVLTPNGVLQLLQCYGPDVIAAIDAPLAWRDACQAERQLGRAFGRYHAAPYMARSQFLRDHAIIAGPELGELLGASGFRLDVQAFTARAGGCWAMEVFPHAFHIGAFKLQQILKFKKAPLARRQVALREYHTRLMAYVTETAPALREALLEALPAPPDSQVLSGKALKSVEDRLDGVTCALAALAAWRDGLAAHELFGEPSEGYIAVPGARRD